jgi:predicted metal-dependent phosphoesterase TrpH
MEAFFRAQQPIDLHLHSNVYDGSDSPAEVVRAAHAAGVRTMALTDHDSTNGWDEARAECERLGMTFIGGMEMSTVSDTGGGIHLLAYLIDPDDAELIAAREAVIARRVPRLQEMTLRLSEDYEISWEDVLEQSSGTSIDRPHLASAMVKRGHIETVSDFFTLVTRETKYYIPTPAISFREAISLIRGAGGVPITAHPTGRTKPGHMMPREALLDVLNLGLAGFELGHRENAKNPEGLERIREYCEEFDLIVTGSSDYHGSRKENRPGEFTTAPEMLMRIIDEATGAEPAYA